jgi:hypothetical protein
LFKDGSRAPCDKHSRMCPCFGVGREDNSGLSVMWAGHPCLDVSQFGDRLGMVGPQALPFLLFVFEARSRRYSVIFHECTPDFDEALLRQFLNSWYEACVFKAYRYAHVRRSKCLEYRCDLEVTTCCRDDLAAVECFECRVRHGVHVLHSRSTHVRFEAYL